jgi:hypothetical protein
MNKGTAHSGIALAGLLYFLSGCVPVVEKPSDTAVVESDRNGPPPWAARAWVASTT